MLWYYSILYQVRTRTHCTHKFAESASNKKFLYPRGQLLEPYYYRPKMATHAGTERNMYSAVELHVQSGCLKALVYVTTLELTIRDKQKLRHGHG